MARGALNNFSCDYICSYCGDVTVCFDIGVARDRKYSSKLMYCPVCMVDTEHLRLGDKDIVKAQLESKCMLEGLDYEIYDLLCLNEVRKEEKLKEKQFIKK